MGSPSVRALTRSRQSHALATDPSTVLLTQALHLRFAGSFESLCSKFIASWGATYQLAQEWLRRPDPTALT